MRMVLSAGKRGKGRDVLLSNQRNPTVNDIIPKAIRKRGIPPLLSPMAAAGSLVYGGIVRLRNRLYDDSWLKARELMRPVISIGNITLGGSGKTPLAIYLANMVLRAGATPVLLSRGYGRQTAQDRIVAPGDEPRDPPSDLGDEPALIRRHVPQIWLGISKHRSRIGMEIAGRCSEAVFILDDGYQHRKIRRNLNLLVFDRSQPLEGNRMAPLGTLREPLAGARRAHAAIINGHSDGCMGDRFEDSVRRIIGAGGGIYHCIQEIDCIPAFDAWKRGAMRDAPIEPGLPVYLTAAIGNPGRFHRDALGLGCPIKGSAFFRDHVRLNARQWDACIKAARLSGASAFLITEKDAVKISDTVDFPIFVAVQSVRVIERDDLEKRVRTLIGSYR
jgi:tetraacyldisaccharide 4'-kinase